jgi:predicted RNA-binding Zn-ribbon protein involved in translation (DUF1610 family)
VSCELSTLQTHPEVNSLDFAKVPRKGEWMQNYTGFELSELNRIGIVCKDCGTEVIFDLAKSRAAAAEQSCPGCGDRGFLASLNPFGTKPFSIPGVFETLAGLNIKSSIRLYFKKENSA